MNLKPYTVYRAKRMTPHGIEQKAKITANFLQRKMAEYEQLKREIQKLSQEINSTANAPVQLALQPTDDR